MVLYLKLKYRYIFLRTYLPNEHFKKIKILSKILIYAFKISCFHIDFIIQFSYAIFFRNVYKKTNIKISSCIYIYL